eukprot:scaffold1383_cov360-Prasinococcus_capsulatus_cf.AAC.12
MRVLGPNQLKHPSLEYLQTSGGSDALAPWVMRLAKYLNLPHDVLGFCRLSIMERHLLARSCGHLFTLMYVQINHLELEAILHHIQTVAAALIGLSVMTNAVEFHSPFARNEYSALSIIDSSAAASIAT